MPALLIKFLLRQALRPKELVPGTHQLHLRQQDERPQGRGSLPPDGVGLDPRGGLRPVQVFQGWQRDQEDVLQLRVQLLSHVSERRNGSKGKSKVLTKPLWSLDAGLIRGSAVN